MEQTPVSQATIFKAGSRTITVIPQGGHYRVTIRQDSWIVVKVGLRPRTAAGVILKCLKHNTKQELAGPVGRIGHIRTVLSDTFYKLNGVEWIAMSMLHGVRPIILKAPGLFRQRLIYIEPTDNSEVFNLRVVDPISSHRTDPVAISSEVATEAIRTFNQVNIDHHG